MKKKSEQEKRQIIAGLKIFNATGDEALKRAAKPITPTNNQAAV